MRGLVVHLSLFTKVCLFWPSLIKFCPLRPIVIKERLRALHFLPCFLLLLGEPLRSAEIKYLELTSILQILVFFAKRIYFQKDHLWSLGWAKEVHKSSSPCGAPWVPAEMMIRDVRGSSRTILSTMKPIYERNIYAIQHLHLEGKNSKSSFCVLRESSQSTTHLRSFSTIQTRVTYSYLTDTPY